MNWWWILTLQFCWKGEQRWRLEVGRFKMAFDACIRIMKFHQPLYQRLWLLPLPIQHPQVRDIFCNTSSEGSSFTTPLDFSIFNAQYPYVCYQCIAIGLLFILIPKSTIHLVMTSLWRHNVSAPPNCWNIHNQLYNCTQRIGKYRFLPKNGRNMWFSRDFWQNR